MIQGSSVGLNRPLLVMKKTLETVFAPYGKVLDVSLKKNVRMRGQAFVTFDDPQSAQQAIVYVQNSLIFGKPLIIRYANCKSDVAASLDGTLSEQQALRKKTYDERQEKFRYMADRALQKSRIKIASMHGGLGSLVIDAGEHLEPNKILFVQNIPQEVSDSDVQMLFGAYIGFREVRLVPGRKDIAFVEFENEQLATQARDTLHGFQMIPERTVIKVTYARK